MAAIKGRTLKLRDAADVQKQIEKVMKKTVKGCNVGDIFHSEGFAQIDNDGKFASELSIELEKFPVSKSLAFSIMQVNMIGNLILTFDPAQSFITT